MFDVLRHKTYAKLFSAQLVALLGTGLLTVALGLLAFELAGDKAGTVLGTALAIKMVAYVALAPVASAIVSSMPRKHVMIAMDGVRAAIALLLPFVDSVWQVYVMIFLLQAASATFTPTFQALIPDILPKEADYTKALSLSRLAYDLENLISPVMAGLLLLFMSFHGLFLGTAAGFLISALLVMSASLPAPANDAKEHGFFERVTRGSRIYLATPRLRGLLAFNLAVAAAGAMVIVNTVVVVRIDHGGSESDFALALGAFGLGSVIAALLLPSLLDRVRDRTVMMIAGYGMSFVLLFHGMTISVGTVIPWPMLLATWLVLGFGYALTLTPSGRLLRRSAHAEDRPFVFAAQFTLSHACWLLTYPLAGWVGQAAGMNMAMILLGGIALIGVMAAGMLWPSDDPEIIEHVHDDLPDDHPHIRDALTHGRGRRHRHVFVIDDEHRAWPTEG